MNGQGKKNEFERIHSRLSDRQLPTIIAKKQKQNIQELVRVRIKKPRKISKSQKVLKRSGSSLFTKTGPGKAPVEGPGQIDLGYLEVDTENQRIELIKKADI